MVNEQDHETRLNEAVKTYLLAIEAGESPDRETLLAQYPDLTEELDSFFVDEQFIEELISPFRSVIPIASTVTLERPNTDETVTREPIAEPLPEKDKWKALLDPPIEPGDVGQLGRYRILGLLGKGGMGVVLKAYDTTLHRPVALKVMHPKFTRDDSARERFLREARAMAKIDHENVIPVRNVEEVETPLGRVPILDMPLLEGRTLGNRLKTDHKLSIPEVLDISRQIALGLAAAHQQGLIHRDIKPSNIWLEPNGRVRVLDFGLVRSTESESSDKTASGILMGTPAYMSPEQAEGKTTDARTDLFSLGVVLYESLTGVRPFYDVSVTRTLMRVVSHEPPPARELNSDVPSALEPIVSGLLKKNRDDRIAAADQLADQLGHLEQLINQGADTDINFEIPSSTPLRSGSRSRVAGIVVGLAVCLLLILGTIVTATTGLFNFFQHPTTSGENHVSIDIQPRSTHIKPLNGSLEAHIWTLDGDVRKRGLSIESEPIRALPAREGEAVQLHVRLDQPAYVYLFWADAAGIVTPLYPWNDNDEGEIEIDTIAVTPPSRLPVKDFTSPRRLGRGWIFDNTVGLETVVMLARREPLPANYSLAQKIGKLPPAPYDPNRLNEFVIRGWRDGQEITRVQQNRALQNSKKIDDQLLQLVDRFKDDFELIRTMQFAHAPAVP